MEEVCGSAEVEVVCVIQNRLCFLVSAINFVFSFLFVHVAQLSIALGRHTLPHVRVWKGVKDGGEKEVYIWCRDVKRTNLWLRLCCCLNCWYYTNLFKEWIKGYGRGDKMCLQVIIWQIHCKKSFCFLEQNVWTLTSHGNELLVKPARPVMTWMMNWHTWFDSPLTTLIWTCHQPLFCSCGVLLWNTIQPPPALYRDLIGKIHSSFTLYFWTDHRP